MCVVATSVHYTFIFIPEGAPICLFNRKSVYIGPENYSLSLSTTFYLCINSSSVDSYCFEAEGV